MRISTSNKRRKRKVRFEQEQLTDFRRADAKYHIIDSLIDCLTENIKALIHV